MGRRLSDLLAHDAAVPLARYVTDTATQMADSHRDSRTTTITTVFSATGTATTGNVQIGDDPPVSIVSTLSADSTTYGDFDNVVLRNAATVLDTFNVPYTDRFAIMSSKAKGAFLGDTVITNNLAASFSFNAGQLIQTGLPNSQFVERYGFNCAGSNTVTGQTAVGILANANTAVVASTAANTAFTYEDFQATTYIGAVNITLTGTGTTIGGSVGVGQIARIQNTSGGVIIAHGVILRIDTTTATAPVLTLVPYDPKGNVVLASQITTAMSVTIPAIGSVNTAHHREGLIIATRTLREPSPNSGARAATVVDPNTNLLIQIFSGQFNIAKVNEQQAYFMLTGARFSDSRKGVLMLSN